MPIQICEMQEIYYEEVVKLLQNCFQKEMTSKQLFSIWKMNSNNKSFIASLNNQVIGFVWLEKVVDPFLGEIYFYIRDLCVDSNIRRQGVGKRLLNECEKVAKQEKGSYITLTSKPSKVAAHILYQKCGYQKKDTDVFIKWIEMEAF